MKKTKSRASQIVAILQEGEAEQRLLGLLADTLEEIAS